MIWKFYCRISLVRFVHLYTRSKGGKFIKNNCIYVFWSVILMVFKKDASVVSNASNQEDIPWNAKQTPNNLLAPFCSELLVLLYNISSTWKVRPYMEAIKYCTWGKILARRVFQI